MSAAALLDFTLPPPLEAHEPAEERASGRDDVRMLVSRRFLGSSVPRGSSEEHVAIAEEPPRNPEALRGTSIVHAHFRELPRFLSRGDLLVLNTSATVPAALTAIRESGEEIALHWSTSLPGGLAVMEPRKVTGRAGERLQIPGGGSATLLAPYRDSQRLWLTKLDVPLPVLDYLGRWGRPIAYPYVTRRFPLSAYQTVFARHAGSAEMPSAGRPFTRSLLACLRRSGVQIARLLLHTGVASLEQHEDPYEEWFEVPLRTSGLVRATRANGGRVIAVGTTVVRALESSVDVHGNVIASRGWTDLVITPARGVRAVDGVLTGLHEPRATHLAMLEAIGGRETIARAYEAALSREYLWHEFGDMHLIL